MIVNPVLD